MLNAKTLSACKALQHDQHPSHAHLINPINFAINFKPRFFNVFFSALFNVSDNLSVHFSMDFSIEKCITFELDFIRSKMKGWKVRIKKFAVFWVRHRKVLTLLFCPSCPTSGKPPLKFGLIGEVYWVYWHSEI